MSVELVCGTEGKKDYAVVARSNNGGRIFVLAVKPMVLAAPVLTAFGLRIRAMPYDYKDGLSEAELKAALKFTPQMEEIFNAFPLPYEKGDPVRLSLVKTGAALIPVTGSLEKLQELAEKFSAYIISVLKAMPNTSAEFEDGDLMSSWLVDQWMSEVSSLREIALADKSVGGDNLLPFEKPNKPH